jgi:hypothetical protein
VFEGDKTWDGWLNETPKEKKLLADCEIVQRMRAKMKVQFSEGCLRSRD